MGRRTRGFVPGDHLHFPPAQTGGDFEVDEPGDLLLRLTQGVGQSRLGQSEHPYGVLQVLGATGDGRRDGLGGERGRPHRLQLSRRSGQHHDGGIAGDHRSGRGTDRVEHLGADRDHRLFAVSLQDGVEVGVGIARHPPLHDRADLGLHCRVEDEIATAEPGHGRHGHIVGGGTEAAGRDDEVHPLVAQKAQLRLNIGGPVPADRDVSQFNA